MIYPGIAAIIVPLLSIPTAVILLILISIYDIYAVWHAGFMQKMAKYQMEKVKVFGGLFVPYLAKGDYKLLKQIKASKNKSNLKKIRVNVAILGGGDLAWSMIFMGTVLMTFGAIAGLIVAICATIALSLLFYLSEKGRFYPAMPFITSGCFIALGIVYLLNYIKII
jgi:presenilin-like A22 family membrane protease